MMKCKGFSVVRIIGSLLLLSTAFAQVKTPRPARFAADENRATSTRVTSDTDKFEVLMPATPVVKKEVRVISGQRLSLTYYGATQRGSDYAVLTLVGFDKPDWQVAHMLLLDFYLSQRAQSAGSFKAVFQADVSLDGYAGRRFSLEAEGKIGEWRIYEVDKTFYAVAGTGDVSEVSSFKRFFDSFSLSPNASMFANAGAAAGSSVSNPAARWLIILQTFSRHEREKANRKMNLLRGQGYDAQVIDTDSYAKLRPGLLALTMGPFSKRAAHERISTLRSVAPQSYIKAGW